MSRGHDCSDFRNLIADYIIAEISAGDKASLEDHLQVCPSCRKCWSVRRNLWRGLLYLPSTRPSSRLVEETARRAVRVMNRPIIFSGHYGKALAVAASFAFFFGLGFAASTWYLNSLGRGQADQSTIEIRSVAMPVNGEIDPQRPSFATGEKPATRDRSIDGMDLLPLPPESDIKNVSWNNK